MKKRIKQIIGVIIGIIIGISTTVGATTIFNSKDITYSSDKTTKTNVKDSLDELYNKTGKCPKGQYCYTAPVALSDKVELGDYIRMTPTSTSYTPPGELTGCMNDANCTQNTLNPSELNLWRVIRKNEDGTVDVISVYASSNRIYLRGKVGYLNAIGVLNIIAAQYTNEKYVARTRNIGYKNQMEYCTSYEESSCPKDSLEGEDFKLVNKIFGSVIATTMSGTMQRYWHSIRRGYLGENDWGPGQFAYTLETLGGDGGSSCTHCGYMAMKLVDGELVDRRMEGGIRPVLTLESSVKLKNGDGKSESTAYILD